ncbi:MAG: NAD+ synthase [Nitrosopumilus sp.]|nr:NAD+ synthase [Nitrosopumilus sp.]
MVDFTLIHTSIMEFIKNQVQRGGVKGVVLGISGGIDSAVAAYCATNALGKEKVLGLILPDKEITPQQDIDDALEICSILKIEYRILDIINVKNEFFNILEKTDKNLVKGNLLSRTRMCILYYYANLLDRFVLGTGDKSELTIGYFTKYGDGAADLFPIGDLYKTQLKEFAKFLNLPYQIISKKSSARLWEDQETEEEIGLSFEDLDSILTYIDNQKKKENKESKAREENYNINGINLSELKKSFPSISGEKINRVINLINKNEHKFSLPPICYLKQV